VQEQVAAETQQLATAKDALDDQGQIDKFKELIVKAISNKWLIPKVADPNLTCKVLVTVGPGGAVMSVEVVKESGDPSLDQSAQAAIMKASPLPVPEDAELFDKFRSLRLTFRPQGIITG
jgi:colicin import membrane protein